METLSGFISLQGMAQFIAGEIPHADQFCAAEKLYQFEERTGIGIQAQAQSAEDGQIYSVRLLRLQPNIGFYAEMQLPDDLQKLLPAENWLFPWGGEGRRVVAQVIEPVTWPTVSSRNRGSKLVVLTTPLLTNTPDLLAGLQPKALALLPWQPVSGWDLALGGPKPLRWVLPAGSVIYFSHEHTIPALCLPDVAQMGWGVTLEGVCDDVE